VGSLSRIVLVTIDTLRADHLGCYGYRRDTSPNLDRLAAEGLLFRHAFSPSSYTAPTHASLFTSRYPSYHSIGFTNGGSRLDGSGEMTLAELLRTGGFRTAAFVSTIVLRRSVGLDKGFDHYDDTLPTWELNRPIELRRLGADTTAAALAWVREHRDDRTFLWLHYMDVHGAYTSPSPYNLEFVEDAHWGAPRHLDKVPGGSPGGIPEYQLLRVVRGQDGAVVDHERDYRYYLAQYDGGIKYVDAQIGELVEELKRLGLFEETLFIVTSDHGEALGEHNIFFFHGLTVTPDQIRVPLLIRPPSGGLARSGSIDSAVSLVDLMPTVLELASCDRPVPGIQGRSLAPLLAGDGAWPDTRVIFAEIETQCAALDGRFQMTYGRGTAVWNQYGHWLLPFSRGLSLIDYQIDPAGATNLCGQEPGSVEHLSDSLLEFLRRSREVPPPSSPSSPTDDDRAIVTARLKALGYIDD
jgi:arylsulfatase